MNIPTPTEAGNQFEAQLLSWKVPPETVREILEYHSNLTYAPGAMIFWQGAPPIYFSGSSKGWLRKAARLSVETDPGSAGDGGRRDRLRGPD